MVKTFLPRFSTSTFDQTFAMLKDKYKGHADTALTMMTKTKRITINLVTELAQKKCLEFSFKSYLTENQGSTAWIAKAGLLVKK